MDIGYGKKKGEDTACRTRKVHWYASSEKTLSILTIKCINMAHSEEGTERSVKLFNQLPKHCISRFNTTGI